jgi:glycosyltransferase involved in cell wall biosynthesis
MPVRLADSPDRAEQVWATTMVRNEQDVIVPVVEHLLAEGVDGVIVADNLSTDRTRELLDELACRLPVIVVDDREPAYFQSKKMTSLARMAAKEGAAWIIPFDADEIWCGVGHPLADVLRSSEDADVLEAEWITHYANPFAIRRAPFERMRLRDRNPHEFRKIAFRPLPGVVLEQGNHDLDGPAGLRRKGGRLVVHHFRYQSFWHMVSKTRAGRAAYEAAGSDLDLNLGEHWRRLGNRSISRLFLTWVNMYVTAVRNGVTVESVKPQPYPPPR